MYKIPIQTESYSKIKCSTLIPNYIYIFLYNTTLSTKKKEKKYNAWNVSNFLRA